MPHVVLLLFEAQKDADLDNISFQESAKNVIAKTACADGNEYCHMF
jgi:hypothetical protein